MKEEKKKKEAAVALRAQEAARVEAGIDQTLRTVNVVINTGEQHDYIKSELEKYGEIEKFQGQKNAVITVKFASLEAAQAAREANFEVNLPVTVHGKKNKYTSVYFEAPADLLNEGRIDDDLIAAVQSAFSEKGDVVDVYHKGGKYLVVQFETCETRDAVVASPRCEVNDVTIYKVSAGIPDPAKIKRQRKQENMRKQESMRKKRKPQNGQNGQRKTKKNKGKKKIAESTFDGQPPQ